MLYSVRHGHSDNANVNDNNAKDYANDNGKSCKCNRCVEEMMKIRIILEINYSIMFEC